MASPPARPLSGGMPTSPRPPESAIEVLYNTAVQSFVRRDHVKTHSTLTRLLTHLQGEIRLHPRRRWYDLSIPSPRASISGSTSSSSSSSSSAADLEEWLIKTFKLSISAHASLYTDPPGSPPTRSTSHSNLTLPTPLLHLIPPNPPAKLLTHVFDQCSFSYPEGLLPPPLISTLILASLKLQPQEEALGCIHKITEEWLSALPDDFMEGISRQPGRGDKRVEGGREGYLKVLELITGEVLAREGEWEMARGILDGDTLLGAKRKEALYRHLRQTQTRREAPSSVSSSGILPSPSDSLVLPDSDSPTPTANRSNHVRRSQRNRPSSSSAHSASSSESTARPASELPTASTGASLGSTLARDFRRLGYTPGLGPTSRDKGKGKETETTDSESTLPSKIVVNPPSRSGPSRGGPRGTVKHWLLSYLSPVSDRLPVALRNRLWGMSAYQLASLAVPLPLFVVLAIIAGIRRRQRRGLLAKGKGKDVVAPVVDGLEQVRARLVAARRQGLWGWFVWFLRWWAAKVAGVWNLGTTVTYL